MHTFPSPPGGVQAWYLTWLDGGPLPAAPSQDPRPLVSTSSQRLNQALSRLLDMARSPCRRMGAPSEPVLSVNVDVASPADLLALCMRSGQSGALLVLNDDGERALFLERGTFTGACSTQKEDRLGEVLWRKGRISLDQLVIASANIRPGFRLGRCLVELGFLAPTNLYETLRDQALAVLEEACLQAGGTSVFVRGLVMENPLSLQTDAQEALARAAVQLEECREIEAEVLFARGTLTAKTFMPPGLLSEGETAVLQLAASSKGRLSRVDLLKRAGLGRLEGLRALKRLLDDGFLSLGNVVEAPPGPQQDAALLTRLAEAINVAMDVLDEGGFGALDSVLEFLEHPPAGFQDAFAVLNLEGQRLAVPSVVVGASMVDDGATRMQTALRALLDFALFEARDTLPDDAVKRLTQRLAPFHVVP